MADNDITILAIGALAIGAYFLFFNKETNIFKKAYDAGDKFMEDYLRRGTTTRGGMEKFPAPYVPQTPEGFNASNWTWDLKSGTKLGLPANMTPGEFCAGSPESPICAEIRGG